MKKRYALFYLFLFLPFLIKAQFIEPDKPNSDKMIKKGRETPDLKLKRYYFSEAIRLDVGSINLRAHWLRGEACAKLGQWFMDSLPKLRGESKRKVKLEADSAYLMAYNDLKITVDNDKNKEEAHFLLAIVCTVFINKDAESEASFKTATELDKKNPIYRIERGIFFNSKKKYTEALADFDIAWRRRDAREVKPILYRLHYGRGVAWHHLDSCAKAIADFQEALKYNPKYSPIHNALGAVYKTQKKNEEALNCFSKAIELDPDYADARYNRGVLLIEQKKMDEAKSDLDIAIEADTLHDAYYYSRSLVFLHRENYNTALEDLNQAIRLNPNYSDYFFQKGYAYYQLNQDEAATKTFLEAKSMNVQNAKTYYYLGLIKNRKGRINHDKSNYLSAIDYFTPAIQKDSTLVGAYVGRGFARYALSKPEAIEDFNKAVSLDAKCADAYYGRALIRQTEDPSVSLKDLEEALHYKKDFIEARRLQGELFLVVKKYVEALSDFNTLIHIQPDSSVLYHLRGLAYHYLDKHEEAIGDFTRCLQQQPKNTQSLYYLGLSYFKQKTPNYDKSIQNLDKAIELNPNFEEAVKAKHDVEKALADHRKANQKPYIVWESPANEYFRCEIKDSTAPNEIRLRLKGHIQSLSEIKGITINIGNSENRAVKVAKSCCSENIDTVLIIPTTDTVIWIRVSISNQAGDTTSDREIKVVKNKDGIKNNRKGRIAFVVGNNQYQNANYVLNNAGNDAKAMTEKLKGLDFTVMESINDDKNVLQNKFQTFIDNLKNYEVGLVYYAGHGVQYNKDADALYSGENYLVPIDATVDKPDDLKYNCISLSQWLSKMQRTEASVNIVIVDACRNNPFIDRSMRSMGNRQIGLAPETKVAEGTCVIYATEAGKLASDKHEYDENMDVLLMSF
jgi:tetratricopeptide (TPR) repeat protein